MATIGLVVRPGVERARRLAFEIIAWAEKHGHIVYAEQETAEHLGLGEGLECSELTLQADPIVTLGGDGTLIGVARYVTVRAPLLLGVNFGNLGFLTEIAPSEVFDVLEDALEGNVLVGERCMLSAQVVRDEETIFSSPAVNDAVVQKGTRDKLLGLDFSVEGEEVMRIRADGLIIATPTGSTAYSLAAGGSICHPNLHAVLVTPICAHSLTYRPFILPLDSQLTVRVPEYDGEVFLSIDGQESCALQVGDVVNFSRDPHVVRFVRSPSNSYFAILRNKLNWGIANKAD